jgi:transcriptional regulator with XRE-family HTH domain
MTILEKIGSGIRERREALGLSRDKFCDKMPTDKRITERTLMDYESGKAEGMKVKVVEVINETLDALEKAESKNENL